MDYHLEGEETGLTVLEAFMQHIGKQVPAILITANYTEALRVLAQARGYPLLNKPLKPAALRALMAQLVTNGAGALAAVGEA